MTWSAAAAEMAAVTKETWGEATELSSPGLVETLRLTAVWSGTRREAQGAGVGFETDTMPVLVAEADLAPWGEVLRAETYAELVRYPDDMEVREVWQAVKPGPSRADGFWRFDVVRR